MSDSIFKMLLDESNQMIQISDMETFEMKYANKPATLFTNHSDEPYVGTKCYKYMMGLDEQCPFCPMRLMKNGEKENETEIDNGNQVFKVKTVLTEYDGKPAFIEYATDVTLAFRAQEIYSADMNRLLKSIPDALGIYHLNITKNTIRSLKSDTEGKDGDSVDYIIDAISNYISSSKDQEEFNLLFSREKLKDAYNQGKNNISMDAVCKGHGQNHWVRISARNIVNPQSGDLESFLYVVDISNEKTLEDLANRDPLTGLYNKVYFKKHIEKVVHNDAKNRALVFLDIDNFKQVNDIFGHLVGDMVISRVANNLKSVFSDLDVIARFGGDEYCVYLENITKEILEEKIRRLKLHFLSLEEINENDEVGFTCSFGAFISDKKIDCDEMIKKADEALYKAKESGKNKLVFVEE